MFYVVCCTLYRSFFFFFFKQKTAYELRISDWSSDVCSSDLTTFTLLAWAFAYAFSACQAWVPVSFSEVSVPPQPRTWMELLFLSFSTLSGVGLSDIVPLSPLARALTMLAMFSGVMYIAIAVSRVIALTVRRQQHR